MRQRSYFSHQAFVLCGEELGFRVVFLRMFIKHFVQVGVAEGEGYVSRECFGVSDVDPEAICVVLISLFCQVFPSGWTSSLSAHLCLSEIFVWQFFGGCSVLSHPINSCILSTALRACRE